MTFPFKTKHLAFASIHDEMRAHNCEFMRVNPIHSLTCTCAVPTSCDAHRLKPSIDQGRKKLSNPLLPDIFINTPSRTEFVCAPEGRRVKVGAREPMNREKLRDGVCSSTLIFGMNEIARSHIAAPCHYFATTKGHLLGGFGSDEYTRSGAEQAPVPYACSKRLRREMCLGIINRRISQERERDAHSMSSRTITLCA